MKAFYYLLGAVAVIGAAVVGYQTMGPGSVSIPITAVISPSDTAGWHGYIIGSDSAPVTIVEYADFQCPWCGDFDNVQWPVIYDKLVRTGKLRWVFKDWPIDQLHSNARLAAHAAACADDQGKFWPMKERIYAYQAQWEPGTGQYGKFRDYFGQIGGDTGAWEACMRAATHAGRIQATKHEGELLGVNGTPNYIIGGRLYPVVLTSDQITHLVDSLIAVRPAADGRPSAPKAPARR